MSPWCDFCQIEHSSVSCFHPSNPNNSRCSRCAELKQRLAEAKKIAQEVVEGRKQVPLMGVRAFSKAYLMAQAFLSCPTTPSKWVVVEREVLNKVLDRWNALELDIALRYRGVEPIQELVEAKNHILAALGKKGEVKNE